MFLFHYWRSVYLEMFLKGIAAYSFYSSQRNIMYEILEGEVLLGARRQKLNSCLCISYFEVPKSCLCLYLSEEYTWIMLAVSCPCVSQASQHEVKLTPGEYYRS
jgi:hypothetical protein